MKIPFSKYHGLGNDFLIFDCRGGFSVSSEMAALLCDRRRGIGADGVLSLVKPEPCDGGFNIDPKLDLKADHKDGLISDQKTDLMMKILNSDGSIAKACGNGLRCFAWHCFRTMPSLKEKKSILIMTGAGYREASILERSNSEALIKADMGGASLNAEDIPLSPPLPKKGRVINESLEIEGIRVKMTALSVGNPHAVVFHEDYMEMMKKTGFQISTHPAFPGGVNAGFAQVTGNRKIRLAVWERGAGPTRACGSGACAAVVAARINGKISEEGPVKVYLPGGELMVETEPDFSRIWLMGPAVHVFDGEIFCQDSK